MISIAEIRAEALRQGIGVKHLLALAPQNDPFSAGHAPAQRKAAEWFAQLYESGAFLGNVHLRRLHYFAISIEAIKPGGEHYLNTERDWKWLCNASKAARYLGLVPLESFDDKRAPPPVLAFTALQAPARSEVEGLDFPVLYAHMPALPQLVVHPPSIAQPYALECWIEKNTCDDVLRPLCRDLGATLVTGLGELSITACVACIERARRDGRPVRIAYISDFDPGGAQMPISVGRKLQYLAQPHGLDIGLMPIALTAEQVRHFSLPKTPIKESEARRGTFELVHGEGGVELDALQALHPGALRRIVVESLAPYIDEELDERLGQAHDDVEAQAQRIMDEVRNQFAERTEQARAELVELDKALGAWRKKHKDLWSDTAQALRERAHELEGEYPTPEVEGDERELLFDSRRGYFEQTATFRAHRNGAYLDEAE